MTRARGRTGKCARGSAGRSPRWSGPQPADRHGLAGGRRAARVRPAADDRPPRSGLARHAPAGNGLDGGTFQLAAAPGTHAGYVRNPQAGPTVRVTAGGIWRAGTAVVLPGEDPAARSRTLPHQRDAAIGTMMAPAPLTIRIDLDPLPQPR